MKKLLFFLITVLFFISCKEEVVTVTKKSAPPMEQKLNYFYTLFDTIVDGQTVYGRAMYHYGNGQDWDSIVAQNPFLKEKDRIRRDSSGVVYVLIKPKEVLKINKKAELKVSVIDVNEPKEKKEDVALNLRNRNPLLFTALIIIVIIFFAIIISFLTPYIKIRKKPTFSENPAKEGPAYVEYGINDEEEALAHFIDIAQVEDPNLLASRIIVKDLEHKFISTRLGQEADVHFANGTIKKLMFINEPGWKAQVSRDKGETFRTEAYFEECGNPITRNDSMLEKGLVFTDEPILFGNESAEKTQVVKPMQEKPDEKKVEPVKTEEKLEDNKIEEASVKTTVTNIESVFAQNVAIIKSMEGQEIHKLKFNVKYKKEVLTTEFELETKNKRN